MYITQKHISRRTALKGVGVTMALPFLEAMVPARATFAQARGKVRLAAIEMVHGSAGSTAFGIKKNLWAPAAVGRDFDLSPSSLAPLEPFRNDLTIISNTDVRNAEAFTAPEIGGDHASEACFLTSAKHPTAGGFRNSVSLDYLAAKHVGPATRFPLLTLSTQDGSPLTHTSSGAGVPALYKPSDIFARLFLAGKARDIEMEMARLKRGQSVLDRMGERFAALKPCACCLFGIPGEGPIRSPPTGENGLDAL